MIDWGDCFFNVQFFYVDFWIDAFGILFKRVLGFVAGHRAIFLEVKIAKCMSEMSFFTAPLGRTALTLGTACLRKELHRQCRRQVKIAVAECLGLTWRQRLVLEAVIATNDGNACTALASRCKPIH